MLKIFRDLITTIEKKIRVYGMKQYLTTTQEKDIAPVDYIFTSILHSERMMFTLRIARTSQLIVRIMLRRNEIRDMNLAETKWTRLTLCQQQMLVEGLTYLLNHSYKPVNGE